MVYTLPYQVLPLHDALPKLEVAGRPIVGRLALASRAIRTTLALSLPKHERRCDSANAQLRGYTFTTLPDGERSVTGGTTPKSSSEC